MKTSIFPLPLDTVQLFSMKPYAVRRENFLHNSNAVQETHLVFLLWFVTPVTFNRYCTSRRGERTPFPVCSWQNY